MLNRKRPSPSAIARKAARASPVSGKRRPKSISARSSSVSSASSSRRRRTKTWARDSSAPISSKDGFSVVAPTRITVPSSTTGRNASCWARLKRWISSTKRSVPRPVSRRFLAASNTLRRSATPEKTADSSSKARSVSWASNRAIVVLPQPGGPQRIIEARRREATMRPIGPSGPRRWSWPTMSPRLRGRSRSASGCGASFSNSVLIARRVQAPSCRAANSQFTNLSSQALT